MEVIHFKRETAFSRLTCGLSLALPQSCQRSSRFSLPAFSPVSSASPALFPALRDCDDSPLIFGEKEVESVLRHAPRLLIIPNNSSICSVQRMKKAILGSSLVDSRRSKALGVDDRDARIGHQKL